MQALHGAGKVHSDLKPENVIHMPDHMWYFIDLGCTQAIGALCDLPVPPCAAVRAAPSCTQHALHGALCVSLRTGRDMLQGHEVLAWHDILQLRV